MARDKKIPMTVHLPGELVAALKAEQLGDTFSQVVTARLVQALKLGPSQRAEGSELDKIELRKKEAEAAMAEQRAAILAGDYVRVDAMKAAVQRRFAVIRSRILNLPSQIVGLAPEQFADATKAAQDCLSDLARPDAEAVWDDLEIETADAL